MFFKKLVFYIFGILAVANLALAKCVSQELTFTWEDGAPDGQTRKMIMTNGAFPGPDLIFDEGDDVEIVVHNNMDFNVTVHWHGLLLQGASWSDGTPGLSQKPIDPGESFVYRFKAEPAGTYWYHSHSRMTLLDGLYGSIFIRPRPGADTPFHMIRKNQTHIDNMMKAAMDPHLLLISDWAWYTSEQFDAAQISSGLDIFCVDSVLINGKGSSYCPDHQYLIDHEIAGIDALFDGQHVSDKGCYPFVFNTEGPWIYNTSEIHPELIPAGMWSGCVESEGEMEIVQIDSDENEWMSLSFVGAATFFTGILSVDNHTMWVYEVDGQYIEPVHVQAVNIYAGERYSVMVHLNQRPGNYTIRISDDGHTQVISGYGMLQYTNANPKAKHPVAANIGPYTNGYYDIGGNLIGNITTVDSLFYPRLVPYPRQKPAKHADVTYFIYPDRDGHTWAYTQSGNGTYQQDRDAYTPLLYNISQPDAFTDGLVLRTLNGSWVDFIVQVADPAHHMQVTEFPHFMHKHSSKVWIIGHGLGVFNWSTVDEAIKAQPHSFNLDTPAYRDTFLTTFFGASWVAVRYQVTNPGAWMFHCHIESHLAGGMAMVILDGVDAWPEIPPEYAVDQHGFFPGQDQNSWSLGYSCDSRAHWGDSAFN